MYRFEPPPAPQFGAGSEPDDPYADPGPATADRRPPAGPRRTAPAAPHPRTGAALVLGILSVCGVAVLGPVAWVVAHLALREVDRSPVPTRGRWQLVVARTLGIVGSVFLLLWMLAGLFVAVVVGVADALG
ncbi:hypothetical protein AVL62_10875 [Serinicoccus chungangensis]|uniref:DUF4190 domain-containing protein n=1 Tax=Serinicoccus chungangensis TaxID=767452 RepID=A0A0W8IEV6_9MICO|nr:DUF4190 domain-containing protein [Serinicoccus chungangensis]KUG58408.1 hypothetical protein AVL62_10875 [Serinicoccus chungangensis]